MSKYNTVPENSLCFMSKKEGVYTQRTNANKLHPRIFNVQYRGRERLPIPFR